MYVVTQYTISEQFAASSRSWSRLDTRKSLESLTCVSVAVHESRNSDKLIKRDCSPPRLKRSAGAVRVSLISPRSLHEAIERSREELCRGALLQTLQARYDSLTQRGREVLKLVTSGYLNKQVSAELGIAEITVKIHRGNMVRKMRARSIVELVTMASTLADSAPQMSTYRTRHRQMQFLLPAGVG